MQQNYFITIIYGRKPIVILHNSAVKAFESNPTNPIEAYSTVNVWKFRIVQGKTFEHVSQKDSRLEL